MSHPPYHLRTNKAVERLLFVELLRRLDKHLPHSISIEEYSYISLGGPFLEDFWLMHSVLNICDMKCIELLNHVMTRQNINLPCSGITLINASTRNYIDAFGDTENPYIVWLDYDNTDWLEQITECCDFLRKLPDLSVLKVTLSGSPASLKKGPQSFPDARVGYAERFNERFGDFGPFTSVDMGKDKICETLFKVLRRAVAEAVPDSSARCVRSLSAYQYNDGTPILTVTMLVGPEAETERVVQNLVRERWPFFRLQWRGPKAIAVPDLSLRERLAINRLLPEKDALSVLTALKLELSDKAEESLNMMNHYVEFYRHVPQFLRLAF